MLPTDHLPAFLITVYVLILVPGPSVLFTISRGVALGRRAALASVLGNTSRTPAAAGARRGRPGLAAGHSDAVYTVVKLIGAAYLVVLGVRSIRDRRELAGVLQSSSVAPRSLARTIREGFVVGATNPKGVLIFTAVLPQFIDRSRGHATLQLLSLGFICALVALLSDSCWALASGTARAWLGRSPRRLQHLSVAGGVSLIALGAGLALTGRKS